MINKLLNDIKETINKETISEKDFFSIMTDFNDKIFKCPGQVREQMCFTRTTDWYEYYIPRKITIRSYLNVRFPMVLERFSKGIEDCRYEWGILICQEGIWLLNNDIPVSNTEFGSRKSVLKILFNNKSDMAYLDYFSYENLLGKDKKTYYFKDIIVYKNTCFSSENYKSWQPYHTTLKRYLNYYASIVGEYKTDYYISMRMYHFASYIKQQNKIKTANTIRNQFFYIKDFMVNWAKNDTFDKSSKDIIAMCDEVLNEPLAKKNETDIEKIVRIIKYLERGANGLRNKTIYLMLLCFGIERRKLCALKWRDIDKNCQYINIGNHPIIMPHLLQESIRQLKTLSNHNDIYIFGNSRTQNMKPLPEGVVYSILSSIKNINLKDEFYGNYTTGYIRKWLFRYLLEQEVPLQDILKLMNISISNLSNFITDDELWDYITEGGLDKGNRHMLEGFMFEVEEIYKR